MVMRFVCKICMFVCKVVADVRDTGFLPRSRLYGPFLVLAGSHCLGIFLRVFCFQFLSVRWNCHHRHVVEGKERCDILGPQEVLNENKVIMTQKSKLIMTQKSRVKSSCLSSYQLFTYFCACEEETS